jgi:CBS domain-containing protein
VKVEELLTPLMVSVNAETPISAAASLMRSNNVGFLPVRAEGRLVGGVTDRDIVVRAVAEGLDIDQTPVEAIMTPRVLSVRADTDTDDALRIMEHERVSRLMVVDRDDQLIGILSVRDIPRTPIG